MSFRFFEKRKIFRMAERYSTSEDRRFAASPMLSADGNVAWGQSGTDTANSSVSDTTTEEGYVTAEDDNTPYMSPLDSSGELALDNLNDTLANSELRVEDQEEIFITTENSVEQISENGNKQVVFHTSGGSDELFSIQIAQDEDRSVRNCLFQFRKNDYGQLEAIPEPIQMLPMHDEAVPEETTTKVLVHHEDNSDEYILADHGIEDDDSSEEREAVDVKPGLLHLHNVKQEIQEQPEEYAAEEPEVKAETELLFCNREHFAERPRGRPLRTKISLETEASAEKNSIGNSRESTEKVEIACPKWDKSFPS